MKIIFLDFDGVLNSEVYYRTVERSVKDWRRFDPSVVALIKKLIEEFDLKIVVSSTCGFGVVDQLRKELTKNNLINYMHKDWATPNIYPRNRGKEIKLWMEKHPEINNYIIIYGSDEIFEEQKLRFVKTDIIKGMTDENYFIVKSILNRMI